MKALAYGVLTALPVPAQTDLPRGETPNLLCPKDVIAVRVYQEEDLDTKAQVDSGGRVTLPLLGPVEVGGQSPEAAARRIQALYEHDFLVNPRVDVQVLERGKMRFTVMGQVQKPGTYEFPANEPVNLLQAIAIAGGYTRLAAPSRVTIQRDAPGQTARIAVDAKTLARRKDPPPPTLQANDIVTVGERTF